MDGNVLFLFGWVRNTIMRLSIFSPFITNKVRSIIGSWLIEVFNTHISIAVINGQYHPYNRTR